VKRGPVAALLLAAVAAASAHAYPVDGYPSTGITRLLAFDLAREGLLKRGTIKPGSLRRMDEVRLQLRGEKGFSLPRPDSSFSNELRNLLGPDAPSYGIAVLDLSDPDQPLYAEQNASRAQLPGSVGKIMVLLGWFQALADLYPNDYAARNRVMRESIVTANAFIHPDDHVVPVWHVGDPKLQRRVLVDGDQGNMWTWLDWMISASSNAAGSTVMSQLVLLKHYGKAYPVPEAEAQAWLASAPKSTLQGLLSDAMFRPIRRNGLDPSQLSQGSLFTKEGKARIPGAGGSTSTPRELLHYLVLMEQGRLVDEWSSLQIKRLLYLTDIRIRYASQPALDDSAVYFKSGSLYACRPEAHFACDKYKGNVKNLMNSIAVVESEEQGQSLHYLVAVLSNVLRKDSAEEHQALALRIHRLIELRHGLAQRAAGGDIAPVYEQKGGLDVSVPETQKPTR